MTTFNEGKHPASFILTEGDGHYSRDNITIASGAGVLAPGTVIGKITSGGKWTISAPGASDGSQTPKGILIYGVDATSADVVTPAIVRLAEVNVNELTLDATINDNTKKATAYAALAAVGIVVR